MSEKKIVGLSLIHISLAAAHTLGIAVDIPSAIILSILATLSACGASGAVSYTHLMATHMEISTHTVAIRRESTSFFSSSIAMKRRRIWGIPK